MSESNPVHKPGHFNGEIKPAHFLKRLLPSERDGLLEIILPVISRGILATGADAAILAIGSAAVILRPYRDIDLKVITAGSAGYAQLAGAICKAAYDQPVLRLPETLFSQRVPINLVAVAANCPTAFDIKLPRPTDTPLTHYLAALRQTSRSFSLLAGLDTG